MALDKHIDNSSEFFDQEHIYRIIMDFQNMGERRTWLGQSKASSYIQSRLEEIGLDPQVDTYVHDNQDWDNIWVEFSGLRSEKKIVIIAHYDSTSRSLALNSPGADDNASGVSLLLELAKVFKNEPLYHDVSLVFLSNEEHGRAGSINYAKKLKEENITISGVLNIDIVGYGEPFAFFSKELVDLFRLDLPLKKKAKMTLKMLYNFSINIFYYNKKFKIAGRTEDKALYSANFDISDRNFKEKVKWKFDDTCA